MARKPESGYASSILTVMPGFNPSRNIVEIEAGEDGGHRCHHEKECHKQNQSRTDGSQCFSPGPGNDHQIGQQDFNPTNMATNRASVMPMALNSTERNSFERRSPRALKAAEIMGP